MYGDLRRAMEALPSLKEGPLDRILKGAYLKYFRNLPHEEAAIMNLIDLVNITDEKRDHQWEIDFFMALSKGNIKLIHEAPQKGPDGWPYMLAEISEEGTEPAQKLIQWAASKGVGLVINPLKVILTMCSPMACCGISAKQDCSIKMLMHKSQELLKSIKVKNCMRVLHRPNIYLSMLEIF